MAKCLHLFGGKNKDKKCYRLYAKVDLKDVDLKAPGKEVIKQDIKQAQLIQPFWVSSNHPYHTLPPPPVLIGVRPSRESLPLAVKLGCWVSACAAVDSYLSARVGAGEDTPGCISEGREIRY